MVFSLTTAFLITANAGAYDDILSLIAQKEEQRLQELYNIIEIVKGNRESTQKSACGDLPCAERNLAPLNNSNPTHGVTTVTEQRMSRGGGFLPLKAIPADPPVYPSASTSLMDRSRQGRYFEGQYEGTSSTAKDIAVHCFPYSNEKVAEKCSQADERDATTIYVPLMLTFGMAMNSDFYADLRKFKNDRPDLKFYGITYGNVNEREDLLLEVLEGNQGLYDGVVIENEEENSACPSNINWESGTLTKAFELVDNDVRYLMRKNFGVGCNATAQNSDMIDFVRSGSAKSWDSTMGVPDFVTPIFSCHGGEEGRCMKVLEAFPDEVCSGRQRFLFNPYEIEAERAMFWMTQTCSGMPPHDLDGVI